MEKREYLKQYNGLPVKDYANCFWCVSPDKIGVMTGNVVTEYLPKKNITVIRYLEVQLSPNNIVWRKAYPEHYQGENYYEVSSAGEFWHRGEKFILVKPGDYAANKLASGIIASAGPTPEAGAIKSSAKTPAQTRRAYWIVGGVFAFFIGIPILAWGISKLTQAKK